MQRAEIPRTDWTRFLDGFSREHPAWIASLEVRDPKFGTLHESENLALEGIGFDRPSREIVVYVGSWPDCHLTHIVSDPQRIWLWRGEQEGAEALEIVSDGVATVLRVRPPVDELVDALSTC